MTELLAQVGFTIAYWFVYTIVLLFMIKIQGLNNHWGWLFIASLLATLMDLYVDFGGRYISAALLFFCIKKGTGCDLYPDAVFTVSIAWALMFCVDLFLIGMLMGDLTGDLEALEEIPAIEESVEEAPPPVTVVEEPEPQIADGAEFADWTLKGFSGTESKRLAMINTGEKTYILSQGESSVIQDDGESYQVECESIVGNLVKLLIGEEKKILRLTVPIE